MRSRAVDTVRERRYHPAMKHRVLHRLFNLLFFLPSFCILLLVLRQDAYIPATTLEKARLITAPYEFEFLSWTLDALGAKSGQFLLGEERYLTPAQWHDTVIGYNKLLDEIHTAEAELERVFSDPAVADPMQASAALRAELAAKRRVQAGQQALVEAILQEQVASEIRKEGFTLGGAVLPPLLFHFSQIPSGLILSPRNVIRQDANIQLIPGLTLEQQIALEQETEQRLDVSALVVGLGGLGTYPTMIMEITWLNWVAEAVPHEWVHNYLYFTPLGLGYETSPELRTINETAAALAGKALGARMIADYYPELVPPPPAPAAPQAPDTTAAPSTVAVYDERREMHITRVEVDRLLAEGKVEEAEQYMEVRRRFFAEHGLPIRRLNQAYFAFYGAYADTPGERGADPTGPNVDQLFAQCESVGAFLRTVSQVTSLAQLQELIAARTC